MELKCAHDIEDVDLPFIESPFFAKGKVRIELSDRYGPLSLDDLYQRAGGCGTTLGMDRAEMVEYVVRAVERGTLLLIINGHDSTPFCPLVEWDGSQWRPQLSGMGPGSLVTMLLPRLNARSLGPRDVAHLQRFGDWGVARPAPVASIPERHPEPPVPEPPSERRTLRIGVFFDGTGNNMHNDRQLTTRDITNVAKLYDLYRYDGDDGDYQRIYIHGVGTLDGHESEEGFVVPVDGIGLASGVGAEGGHARIELALRLVRGVLANNPDAAPVFDVFGFSRGEALARHFVNLIHRWPPSLIVPDLRLGARAPLRRIEAFPPFSSPLPQVRFVGLFDTVGSFYWPGNSRELDFNLHMVAGSAQRVVHLTAHHEIRRNFPHSSLVDAQGGIPGNLTEIALPGAHSDVGGGYENPEVDFANHEELVVRRRAGLGSNGHTIRRAQAEAEARGLNIRVEGRDVVEIERRATRKELAIHALHRMHAFARQAGVPFRDLDDADPDHVIPAELQAALDAWEAASVRMDTARRLDAAREYLVDYIHTSHREGSLVHAPEPGGERRVFANRPGRRIVTTERELQDA